MELVACLKDWAGACRLPNRRLKEENNPDMRLTIPSLALFVTLLASLHLTAPQASAQDAPSVRRNNVEIAAMGGVSWGFDKTRVMGGGNVGWAATKNLFPYFEATYLPGLDRVEESSLQNGGVQRTEFTADAFAFDTGLHLRAPIAESPVVPYAVIGIGGIRFTTDSTVTLVGPDGAVIDRLSVSQPASTELAVNFGAGIRYYINEAVGLRVEFKGYRPTDGSFDNIYRAAAAIFFQIN